MESGTLGAGQATGLASGGLDFGSDNIFWSHEDYDNKDGNNGMHSDPPTDSNSAKEFNINRIARPSAYPASVYSPSEDSSVNQVVISTVENTMKKYTDNLMHFLEGISSRLSQLELYCYNLDKSIGEMRSDLVRDHGESESKLKYLEKHIEEVHRSVQILRDKQELANTQKELAKLHLARKESSSTGDSQQSDDRTAALTSDPKETKNSSDSHNHQLALVLPHQVSSQPSSQSMAPYYLTNTTGVSQPSPTQYLLPQSQVQDHSRMPTPPGHYHISPTSGSACPQQWSQQLHLMVQPTQQPKIRNPSQLVCSNYILNQSNQPPAEMPSNNLPMQVPFPGASQTGFSSPEAISYGYGAATGRPVQPQSSTQHVKTAYGAVQPGNNYTPSGSRPALHPGNAYLMYDSEGGRAHHPPPQVHFQQSGFPSSSVSPQKPQQVPAGANMVVTHLARTHPYNELIEKLVSMGYRSDRVVGIIQRFEESGQAIDFNSVLDKLNAQSAAEGSQRGWSG